MNRKSIQRIAWGLALVAASMSWMGYAQPARGPVELRVDNLKTPLGIDDPAPRFSWQLRDPARGARQAAYEVMVASTSAALTQGKADVWTSGHIDSSQSMNVAYKGPAQAPGKRYYWRVKVWDPDWQAISPKRDQLVGDRTSGPRPLARRVDWIRDAGRSRRAPRAGTVDRKS